MRSYVLPILLLLLGAEPALGQKTAAPIFDCEANFALYCDAERQACRKKDDIIAERSFSVDVRLKTVAAALYTAVFAGPVAFHFGTGSIVAVGTLSAPPGNPAGAVDISITIWPAKNRFTAVWRSPDDFGGTVAVGHCKRRRSD